MYAILAISFGEYVEFYRRMFMRQWHNMSPSMYVFVLLGVMLIGWLMMKSGSKSL